MNSLEMMFLPLIYMLQRAILENEAGYGLKRWEIGEMASKIGQLYYHYLCASLLLFVEFI